MSAIITRPPTYSASANCQPISTHRTSPSSHTRFVEANWKASVGDGGRALLEDRLADRDRGVGARRRRGAEAGGPERAGAGRPRRGPTRCAPRGTHACTIAEIAKPRTSAHHTAHAMRKASFSADADLRDHVRHSAAASSAARSAWPFPVSVYIVILPSRRERTTPCALSAFMWCETRFCGRSDDPRQVAHAQLVTVAERECQREPSRLAQRAVAPGEALGVVKRRAGGAQALALGGVDVQQLAEHALHPNSMLICSGSGRRGLETRARPAPPRSGGRPASRIPDASLHIQTTRSTAPSASVTAEISHPVGPPVGRLGAHLDVRRAAAGHPPQGQDDVVGHAAARPRRGSRPASAGVSGPSDSAARLKRSIRRSRSSTTTPIGASRRRPRRRVASRARRRRHAAP